MQMFGLEHQRQGHQEGASLVKRQSNINEMQFYLCSAHSTKRDCTSLRGCGNGNVAAVIGGDRGVAPSDGVMLLLQLRT